MVSNGYRRAKRWKQAPLKHSCLSKSRKYWTVKPISDDMREYIGRGEVVRAVMDAAKLNGLLKDEP